MVDTSFGKLRLFDAHTHFFDRSFLEGLAKPAGLAEADAVAAKLGWDAPESPEGLAARWVAEMDRHGVDRMVSIHTLPGSMEQAAAGIAASERAAPARNSDAGGTPAPQGRLVGYASINPLVPNAADLAARAVQLGFRGFALFPGMFHFSPQDDRVRPILQLAHDHALNVFIHCGVLKVGFRTKLGLPSAFDATLANPLALQRPAAEFSKARFIIPHLGSGYFRELFMLADQCPNVYTDTSGLAGWAKYLAGAPTPAQVLRQAVQVMGAERILFGTDSTFFPRGWRREVFDQQMKVFQEAGLTEAQVRGILADNLGRIAGETGPRNHTAPRGP